MGRVKVIGTTLEGTSFNEVFALDNNAIGADLRQVVSEKLGGVDLELFCLGRCIADTDLIPGGSVMHMRPKEILKQIEEAPEPTH